MLLMSHITGMNNSGSSKMTVRSKIHRIIFKKTDRKDNFYLTKVNVIYNEFKNLDLTKS